MAESSYTSGGQTERPKSEAFNEKFDKMVKLASTSLTRAKQFTVEKLGRADSVTSYGEDFDDLSKQIDHIKITTERIVTNVEAMVQPHPGIRLETRVYSKLDRQQPHHSSPHDLLGVELVRAGNEFGPETQYGGYLVRCGQVENKIAISESNLQEKAQTEFITPLKAFLEVDIKNVLRERRLLNAKRLDLDAWKTNVKKAQNEDKLQQAESQLRLAQAAYDVQYEKVYSSMSKIVKTHVNNLGHLRSLMAVLRKYHSDCLTYLNDVDSQTPSTSSSRSGPLTREEKRTLLVNGMVLDPEDARKGRVLYDYDATADGEMSVLSDQMLTVYPIDDDEDYLMAQVDNKFGKIPSTYIELL